MKIVHVCISGGWYEKNAYQDQLLPRYHKKLGHDVTIIAGFYGRWNMEQGCYDIDKTKEKILDDGIKVVRLRPSLPLILNKHIHMFWGLGSAVRRESPDLIFLHGVESPNYLEILGYCRSNPFVRVVCDNHTDRVNSLHHWTTKAWSQMIVRRIIVKKLLPLVSWFYGVTPVRSDFLAEEYGIPKDRIKLLVLGADDEKMKFDKREEIRCHIRKTYDVTDEDFLIVTGGRIDQKKSSYFIDLAEAICGIDDKHLKLLIFGPVVDEVKPLFDKYLKDKVVLAGAVQSDRVYDFFYAADIVAFSGLHSVMWEQAVASRVPCMFRKIAGFTHVDIGGNCLWIDGSGPDYYKGLIESIRTNTDIYESLKQGANKEEANNFLYSHIAQQVLDDVFPKK